MLRRALRSNPSQEYLVYVPSAGGADAPLFVPVHGISRNAHEQARLFAPLCEALGAVLVAPYFAGEEHRDYQRLGRLGRGRRADAALEAILEEVASLTGAAATRIHLFGYSGGAQFAHRYVMAHPHRVARAAVVSAGWYTFPDARKRFPYGIRTSPKLPGVRFDPEEFLRVPISVLVGAKDGGSARLRRTRRVDRQQGVTRVERARNWVQAMRTAAEAYQLEPLVSYVEVDSSNHSFTQFAERGALAERVFGALFDLGSLPVRDRKGSRRKLGSSPVRSGAK